jgi:PAS domain S-box-containing protein
MLLRRVPVALALAGLGLAATISVPLLDRDALFLGPVASVLAAAWFGGFWTGLFTTVALIAGLSWFVFPPTHTFFVASLDDLVSLGLFALVSFLISALVARGRRTAATLEATLWNIDDGVIVTDLQARVTFMNPVAARLTGWSLRDAKGKPVAEIFRTLNEGTHEAISSRITGMLREGVLRESTVLGPKGIRLLVSADGTERPIAESGASVIDERGERIGAVLVFRDISEQRAAAAALRESEAMKAAAFDAALDCVITMDHERRVVDFNAAAEQVFGYRREDAIQRNLGELIIPADLRESGEWALVGRCVETRAMRADGTVFPVEISVAKLPTAGPAMFTAFLRDITERKRSVATIEEARETAERANRLKDEFVATVSHELRTPLSAVLGWTKMLRAGSLSAEAARRAIDAVDRNADALAHLVSDLLDVSRIVTGQLRLRPQDTDAAELVAESVDTMRPSLNAKRITVSMEIGAVPHIFVDPDRLRQIVWNLLSNAIKFTPNGGQITVRVALVDSDVHISLSDTGQGIDPDMLPFVFNRFWQADGASTRSVGGLGLGLAIVRHLVEAHAGSVMAHSAGLNKGSTFTVSLPVRAVIEEESPASSPATVADRRTNGQVLDGIRVLAVDDEADSLDLVAAALGGRGAEVRTAQSADEAIRILMTERPDVLVADIGMPGKDGYALVRELRQQPQGADLPAVALTAYVGEPYRKKALEAGFTEHVGKPVNPDELAALVGELAHRQPS